MAVSLWPRSPKVAISTDFHKGSSRTSFFSRRSVFIGTCYFDAEEQDTLTGNTRDRFLSTKTRELKRKSKQIITASYRNGWSLFEGFFCEIYWNMFIYLNFEISKLMRLLFTSSNYPKCKLSCTSGNLDL